MTVWSPQQNEALSVAGAWMRMKYTPVFYLAGFAGTGKSTLAKHLSEHATGNVAFAAFTGKAARVMRSKGCAGASTIHSLIYDTAFNPATGQYVMSLKDRNRLRDIGLVVIDECSMVNEEIARDLLSFGIPILVLGDPAQLPPPNGAGYFINRQPDYMLTEVHRQAVDSPILRLATNIRLGQWNRAEVNEGGLSVIRRPKLTTRAVMGADIVIVGLNKTRRDFNAWMRNQKGIGQTSLPKEGEILICLKNDRQALINNGEMYVIDQVAKHSKEIIQMDILSEDDMNGLISKTVKVRKEFFFDDTKASEIPFKKLAGTQQFTFGYAITCHKSQGSQWSDVCVFDESSSFREDGSRWLYTAVTRATDRLTLVLRDEHPIRFANPQA